MIHLVFLAFGADRCPVPLFLPLPQIESVELALGGRGEYLGMGTTDKEKLLGQLDVLQTKEAQLQKKELLIMGGVYLPCGERYWSICVAAAVFLSLNKYTAVSNYWAV